MKDVINVDQNTNDVRTEAYRNMIASILNCDSEEFFKKYTEYKQAEMEFEKIYAPFKEKLIALHKDQNDLPNHITIGGVKLTYISPSIRHSIDSKKLKEEEPELAKRFEKTTNVSATIRIDGV